MRRTNIYLTEEQCAALDEIADREATSRAVVIRRLIDGGLLADQPTIEESLAALDASFDVGTAIESTVRGPDARAAHLADVGRRTR